MKIGCYRKVIQYGLVQQGNTVITLQSIIYLFIFKRASHFKVL